MLTTLLTADSFEFIRRVLIQHFNYTPVLLSGAHSAPRDGFQLD